MLARADTVPSCGNSHSTKGTTRGARYVTATVTGAPTPPSRATVTSVRSGGRPPPRRAACRTRSWSVVTAASRAPSRAAWTTTSESLATSPTCTSAKAKSRAKGRTMASSTAALPMSRAGRVGTGALLGVTDDAIDDAVEERRELPRRPRPDQQHDGDGRRGQDDQGVLGCGLSPVGRQTRLKAYE